MLPFLSDLKTESQRIWVRITIISALGMVAAFAASLFGWLIPPWVNEMVGAGAVERLLNILANTMLAVTTFSLSVMVAVRQFIDAQWSPRAQVLHLKDRRTQTVLATFMGAYVFALSSIILLETPYFSEREIGILFLMTLWVIGWVVVTIVRWIIHLQTLGGQNDTLALIADDARRTLALWTDPPQMGANPLTDQTVLADSAITIPAPKSGYVDRIHLNALSTAAEADEMHVYVLVRIGDYVLKGEPLAQASGTTDHKAIQGAFRIGSSRTAEQDPLFGLRLLSEVGSKALSPGINDTGTAIDVLTRLTKTVWEWPVDLTGDLKHPRIWLRPVTPKAMLDAGYSLIARDGATALDVQLRLADCLARLTNHPNQELAEAARALGAEAIERAQEALPYGPDRARFLAELPEALKG